MNFPSTESWSKKPKAKVLLSAIEEENFHKNIQNSIKKNNERINDLEKIIKTFVSNLDEATEKADKLEQKLNDFVSKNTVGVYGSSLY